MKPYRTNKWLIILCGAVFSGLIYQRRTRSFNDLNPELRSLLWRIRSPSLGSALLPLSRLRPATACVEGVALSTVQVASADGTPVTIYCYRPADARDHGPAMLYTHGGGMVIGSAASYHAVVSAYARDMGLVIVSADYRLAPEHPFPLPLDDVYAAYGWLQANAGWLNIDPARVAVGGDSAGGGLTAALCQRIRDEGTPAPIFQLLVYPMLDDRTTLRPASMYRGELFWTEKSNMFGWSSYLGRSPVMGHAPAYAAPARRGDLSGLPPTWIGVGSLDLFYDEDIDYARRLDAAGVATSLDVVEGAYHGFDILSDSRISRSFRARIVSVTRDALNW